MESDRLIINWQGDAPLMPAHWPHRLIELLDHFNVATIAVRAHAARGGLVVGICNGFQILCESGLLPGVLMRNRDLRFICKMQHLKVERNDTVFTGHYARGQVIKVCIAHGEGNYAADDETGEAAFSLLWPLADYKSRLGTITSASLLWWLMSYEHPDADHSAFHMLGGSNMAMIRRITSPAESLFEFNPILPVYRYRSQTADWLADLFGLPRA